MPQIIVTGIRQCGCAVCSHQPGSRPHASSSAATRPDCAAVTSSS